MRVKSPRWPPAPSICTLAFSLVLHTKVANLDVPERVASLTPLQQVPLGPCAQIHRDSFRMALREPNSTGS